MPRRIPVIELQEIVKRLRMRQSIKGIKRELGRHKTVIRKVLQIAEENNWLDENEPLPSEIEVRDAYYEGTDQQLQTHPLDAFQHDITRWVEKDYNFVVMHRMLNKMGVEGSESMVRRYVHRNFPVIPHPVMLRKTIPGEVMEVDFGYLGITWDPKTKSRRRTWFFSGRLRHSRKAYREIVFNQKQETFFFCHIHAFEYFGGVSWKVTPDNLKAAIIQASFEDPLVNRAYRSLAEHYGFMISPCVPYSPEHKGGVESDVKYVKRNFWPEFKEQQRWRGHEILYADELVEGLEKWNLEVSEVRIIQKVGRSPMDLFEQEEVQALKTLPAERWDPVTCKEPTVGVDWRIQFEKAFYSVPYKFIGKKVLVMGNSTTVRIFFDYQEITNHERATKLWEYKRKPEHAPPHLEEYLNLSTKGLLIWAGRLGPSVRAVAEQIFEDKAVDGIRPVRGLIRFADKYSVLRLEAACKRALLYETPTYMSVKNILLKRLDILPEDQPAEPSSGQLNFRFQREFGYFDPLGSKNTIQ
ncbi:hypothetical protein ES703_62680 [subsurface metagenome]